MRHMNSSDPGKVSYMFVHGMLICQITQRFYLHMYFATGAILSSGNYPLLDRAKEILSGFILVFVSKQLWIRIINLKKKKLWALRVKCSCKSCSISGTPQRTEQLWETSRKYPLIYFAEGKIGSLLHLPNVFPWFKWQVWKRRGRLHYLMCSFHNSNQTIKTCSSTHKDWSKLKH